ncbi:MAG: hypothetical protein Q8Q09_12295 [Deltaproteobacteria bacterium]|nr:hypothetical protein [Deltaproteobacteria bacterium]
MQSYFRASVAASLLALAACAPPLTLPTEDADSPTDVRVADARADQVPSGDSSASDSALDAPAVDARSAAGPYPSGPYGNAVGQTLADLSLMGFANPQRMVPSNTLTYGSLRLASLRESGAQYALIHSSGFL